MLLRHFAARAAVLVALVGCGSTSGDDTIEPGSTLVVTPAEAQLEVLNGTPVSQPFTVMLVEPGGPGRDVTAEVAWSLSDPAFGDFAGATFTARGGRAGKGMVHATLDTLVGDAQIEITLRGVRVAADVPPGAPGLFAGATDDPAQAPDLVYPADQVIVPANLGDFEAHWTDGHGHDLFEVSLVGDHVDQRVYVRAGATGWTAFTPTEWETAARSAEQLTLGVRGLTEASPAVAGTAASHRVFHGREDLQGGLYYWAATAAAGQPYGIFRYDFGAVGQPAEEFYTNTQAGRCVACHALSRDGTRMAITYDGGDGAASVVDVATRTAIPSPAAWNFATYSPDGSRLITSSRGVLTVRDGTTAAPISTVPITGWGTHPDFAPGGDALAYVQATSPGADWHFGGGIITTIPYDAGAGTFGAPRPLVTDGGNNYYPSYSPDGQWLLFNRSTEDAYDDASAELWVVKADGSAPPRKLDLANVAGGLTNSWARWAPFRQTFAGGAVVEDMYWITFSSKRAFGVRQPAGKPQIWMAAFFPGRIAMGGDPTGPAFRLPFQDLGSNNHIAQWTETVVPIGRMVPTGAAR
ncbi:MAG: PD40 domain-containing protein [Myxococcales bacterium]|nr:PD40 domain-containing protein [Myxococcales bacterium]